jgi:hypothetical protein
MYFAIKFLREHNPTATKYSEIDLQRKIEEFMMNCADDEDTIYSGTMGFLVIKDDWNDEYAHFSIVVDQGVCESYESVTIEYPCR